jgi:hypothetical protein
MRVSRRLMRRRYLLEAGYADLAEGSAFSVVAVSSTSRVVVDV